MSAARPLNDKELKSLLTFCKGSRHSRKLLAIVECGLSCMRANEIALMLNKDVVDEEGKIKDSFVLPASRSKNGKTGRCYFTKSAKKALRLYIDTEKRKNPIDHPNAQFFESQKGGGHTPNSLTRLINKLFISSGIDTSSHSLRKTGACRLARVAPIPVVQAALNHKSLASTNAYLMHFEADTIEVMALF